VVFRPSMYEDTRFYGFAALGYSHNPLRASTAARTPRVADRIDNVVEGQLTTYFIIGTEIANRVGFNVSLPILLWGMYGNDPLNQQVGTGGIGDTSTALHDTRIDVRLRLWDSASKKDRLGLGGALFADSGDSSGFASDDSTTGWIFASGEHHFEKFFIAGMIGPHFRPERSVGGQNGGLFLDDELRLAVGGYMPLRQGKIRLGLELFGGTGLAPAGRANQETRTFMTARNTGLEWLGQVRIALDKRERVAFMGGAGTRLSAGYGSPDFRLLASIGYYFTVKDTEAKGRSIAYRNAPDVPPPSDRDGDGYPDDIDKCPDIKEDGKPPDPSDGCPAGSDRDGDGIPDDADACPDVPEDKDGVQDTDGCPEKDADNDKIPDTEDKCPTEPGKRSADAEKNGCPQLTKVTEEGTVATMEPIEFEFGKATIKPKSFPILDEIVTLMKSRPKMRIGVYGHTDNVGSDENNLRLSKARAASVMQYLIKKGIAAGRLESEGFGETKPVQSNDTYEGRAKNRRVEFKILSE
jgi:OmpA-OmpF porin, OOP family